MKICLTLIINIWFIIINGQLVLANNALINSFQVKPTVFFKKVNGILQQRIDLKIASSQKINTPMLKVERGGIEYTREMPALRVGENEITIYLPDYRKREKTTFSILEGNRVLKSYQEEWQPQRHWEIYLVHSSHHDLGYTDLPDRVLEEHKNHLKKVVQYCKATEDWPEDSKFHYVIEQGWSVAYFMEHLKDLDLKEKFIHYVQNGQIEITALFGNQNIDLSSPEEINRLIYPSFKLQKEYGFDIKTAETNDMPGINWGIVSVLRAAGIRYLYAGIQDYFNWGQSVPAPWDEAQVMNRNAAGAFYWQGPDGKKVLFWYGGGSIDNVWLWEHGQAEQEIAQYLAKHEKHDYPFRMLLTRVLGGYRDNSLPDIRHSELVKEWNKKWDYPRIKFTNSKTFFEEFEQQHGASLRTIRGDFNPTDYNIGAICTPRETGINRMNQNDLVEAETFSTLAASLTDWPYPREQIDESYEHLQLYNEHCWGLQHPTGPAHAATISQKLNHSYQAAALVEDLQVKALNRLADEVNLTDSSYYLIVYNSLSHSRTDLVTVAAHSTIPSGRPFFQEQRTRHNHTFHVWRSAEASNRKLHQLPTELFEQPFAIKDMSTGKIVPHQVRLIADPMLPVPYAASRMALSQVTQNSVGGLNYQRNQAIDLNFIAADVPALGYKVFQVIPQEVNQSIDKSEPFNQFETPYYQVNITDKSFQVTNKATNHSLFRLSSPYFPGQFFVRNVSGGEIELPVIDSIKIIENGPIYTRISIKATHDNVPKIQQEVTFYHALKRIDFATRILKDATPYKEYYIAFPFDLDNPKFRIRSTNSILEPIKDQLPGTNTDAYTARDGLAIFNKENNVIFSNVEAPIVRLGKLWPGYLSQAHHGRKPRDFEHAFTDKFKQSDVFSLVAVNNFRTNFTPVYSGDMLFRYSITSASGSYNAEATKRFTASNTNPLIPVIMQGPQEGNFPQQYSYLQVSDPALELTTLKAAEDGKGHVLRLLETSGKSGKATIQLDSIQFKEAWLTNLQEERVEKLVTKDNLLEVPYSPFCIISIYLASDSDFKVEEKYFHSY